MGLRFCNEVVVAAEQLHPPAMEEAIEEEKKQASSTPANNSSSSSGSTSDSRSSFRRNSTLVNNQGFVAVPFVVDMGATAPPSIRLIPCRPYSGAPIGKVVGHFHSFHLVTLYAYQFEILVDYRL